MTKLDLPTQTKAIDEENWGTARYLNESFQVFIALSGFPDASGETQLRYCLTLADLEFNEVMQKPYAELEAALQAINSTYGQWQLSRVETPKSGEGCSSCAAH